VRAKVDGDDQAARQALAKAIKRKGSLAATSTVDTTTAAGAGGEFLELPTPKLVIPHSTSVSQASPRTKLHLPRHSLDMLRLSNRS